MFSRFQEEKFPRSVNRASSQTSFWDAISRTDGIIDFSTNPDL